MIYFVHRSDRKRERGYHGAFSGKEKNFYHSLVRSFFIQLIRQKSWVAVARLDMASELGTRLESASQIPRRRHPIGVALHASLEHRVDV
jgi:hypothetical protein